MPESALSLLGQDAQQFDVGLGKDLESAEKRLYVFHFDHVRLERACQGGPSVFAGLRKKAAQPLLMKERTNLAESLLARAEAGDLRTQDLDAVRRQLDSVQGLLAQELAEASQDLPELETQLTDGLGDAFSLMHYALDELRSWLESSAPASLRLARLLFEKGEDEYAGLRGRMKRIEMHACSSDLPGRLWSRVLEQQQQAEEEDFRWAEAEFSAQLQNFGAAFEAALDALEDEPEEAERQIGLLRLRLAQLLD